MKLVDIGPGTENEFFHCLYVGPRGNTRRSRVGCVYLDDEPYRPYQLIGASKDLRDEIVRRHDRKHREERLGHG